VAAPGMATTRSTFPAAAQSGTPADAVTAEAGPVEPLAPAEAGGAAPPATVLLPHAVSPIRAPAAISASTPRAAVPSGPPCAPAVPAGLLGPTIAGSLLPRPRTYVLDVATARPGSLGPGRVSADVVDRVPDDLGAGDDVGSPVDQPAPSPSPVEFPADFDLLRPRPVGQMVEPDLADPGRISRGVSSVTRSTPPAPSPTARAAPGHGAGAPAWRPSHDQRGMARPAGTAASGEG
jgi:hypothetical protein